VDAEHLALIKQDADIKTKLAAIKEYNRLKDRGGSPHGNSGPMIINVMRFDSNPSQNDQGPPATVIDTTELYTDSVELRPEKETFSAGDSEKPRQE